MLSEIKVTVLQRADGMGNDEVSSAKMAATTLLGCNPAVEAKRSTMAQVEQLRSKWRGKWALGDTEDKVQAKVLKIVISGSVFTFHAV